MFRQAPMYHPASWKLSGYARISRGENWIVGRFSGSRDKSPRGHHECLQMSHGKLLHVLARIEHEQIGQCDFFGWWVYQIFSLSRTNATAFGGYIYAIH